MVEKLIDFIENNLTNCNVELSEENGIITIVVKEVNKTDDLVKEFKDYVKNIDDDLFEDVCRKFDSESEIKLNEFAKIMEEGSNYDLIDSLINKYKNITREVAKEYISNLQKKYLS